MSTSLLRLSRFVVGMVLIFSGFVKGIDPVGTAIKFTDYFQAFGLSALEPMALPLGILLNIAETLIGISLVFGVCINLASWSALLFMGFFTVLTFFLALFNPVSDCGCFGDAIKMTNWQTFYKNLILMPFVIFAFTQRRKTLNNFSMAVQTIIAILSALFILWFNIHSYKYLPFLDFRPYNIGTNIAEKMIIPEGAKEDVYETMLYYKKDGVTKEFTAENYPWQDTTWKFVDSKSILIEKGYEPPIHDFSIEGQEGDITDEILHESDYVFILISHDVHKAKIKNTNQLLALQDFTVNNNIRFIGLSSSANTEIEALTAELGLDIPFYNTDQTTLKTIVRSNPGLILLYKGNIIGKWSVNNLPNAQDLNPKLLVSTITDGSKQLEKYKLYFLLACSLSIILLGRKLFKN